MPATAAQIAAAQENATHSTGPRTPEGKAKSSRNAIKLGLFTTNDFVLPEESENHETVCTDLWNELYPVGRLEEAHTLEIIRATWRLQRCAQIEAKLADYAFDQALNNTPQDPMQNEAAQRTQSAVDRARATANNTLRRATAELRRLQTNRQIVYSTLENPETIGLADQQQVSIALHREDKSKLTARRLEIEEFFGPLIPPATQLPLTMQAQKAAT